MDKKLNFILYCVVLNCAVIFLELLHFSTRYFGTGLLLFCGGIYLLRNSPFKKIAYSLILIYGLWLCLIGGGFIVSLTQPGFLGTPLFIVTLIAIILSLLLYSKSWNTLIKSSVVYLVFLSITTYLLPNYYIYIYFEKNKMVGQQLPSIKTTDNNDIAVNLKEKKGKILIIDVWNSACGNCIEGFPKFDALKKEFQNDTTMVFYSLNLPLVRDTNKNKIKKFTSPYSFTSLYADNQTAKLLSIASVPQYIIVDKSNNIKYIGDLNTDSNAYYNNFYNILKDIKNE